MLNSQKIIAFCWFYPVFWFKIVCKTLNFHFFFGWIHNKLHTLSLYPNIRFFGLPGAGFGIFGLFGHYLEDSWKNWNPKTSSWCFFSLFSYNAKKDGYIKVCFFWAPKKLCKKILSELLTIPKYPCFHAF